MAHKWMTWAFSFLLAFSMLAAALVILPQGVHADPILPDYAYKVKLTVAAHATGALTNCQMPLTIVKGTGSNVAGTVYLNNHALNWPYDVRFTEDDGTPIDFWREESDATDGYWWIELPMIAAGSTTDYWLYYGYASATDASSGTDTFIMFDDFLGTSIDGAIWSTTGTPTVSGGLATMTTNANGIYSKTAFSSSNCLRVRVYSQTYASGAAGFIGFGTNQRDYKYDCYGGYPTANYINEMLNGTTGQSLGNTGAAPHIYDLYRHTTECGFWVDNVYKHTQTGGSNANLVVHASGDGASSPQVVLDWVAIRLSDASLPLWSSSGTEEENEVPPTWAPTFTSSPATTGTKNVAYTYTATINETGTFTSVTKPAWASWGSPTYSGTPTSGGIYAFHLQATSTAGTLTANQWWNVTVADTWAPMITTSPNLYGLEGFSYYYDADANESVTWGYDDGPAWASFNGATGNLTGTPSLAEAGSYDVKITATSTAGLLIAYQNYTLIINDTWAPTLNSITPYGSSNSSYANWVVGDDFDTRLIYNESCDYLLYTDAAFLSAGGDNGTDTFDVVNISTLVEGSYYVHVEASSNDGTLALWTNWTLDVWPAVVPDAWSPMFTDSAGTSGTIGVLYSYSPTCNESVTYSLETKPDWAIMDDGTINGTPLLAGDYDFELKATSDGGGLDVWQNWTVTVTAPIIPPVVDPISETTNLLVSLLAILLMVAILVAVLSGIKRW